MCWVEAKTRLLLVRTYCILTHGSEIWHITEPESAVLMYYGTILSERYQLLLERKPLQFTVLYRVSSHASHYRATHGFIL